MTTSTQLSKNGIIVILAIALIAAIGYCIYLKTRPAAFFARGSRKPIGIPAANFRTPNGDSGTVENINRYRDGSQAQDPYMVIYDTSDITNYLNCVWPNLTRKTPIKGYHWAVGFYFIRKYDTTKEDYVLDFCVTPTLVDSPVDHSTHVIDFDNVFSDTNYYRHNPKYPILNASSRPKTDSRSDSGNSYDAGQLWP